MRNSLARLEDIPLTEMLLICQISLFSFCTYTIKGDDAIAEILSFKAKWDEQKSI